MRNRIFLLAAVTVTVGMHAAVAATSEWMTIAQARAYTAGLKAKGRIPVKLEYKADEGHTLQHFARLRIADEPNPGSVSYKWNVNTCGLLSKNKTNLERSARLGLDVKAMGGKLKYKSFIRFRSPGSGEAYGCELVHDYKSKQVAAGWRLKSQWEQDIQARISRTKSI